MVTVEYFFAESKALKLRTSSRATFASTPASTRKDISARSVELPPMMLPLE